MSPAALQANLKATCGHAVNRTGFSFTTQDGPRRPRYEYYYDAYKAYAARL